MGRVKAGSLRLKEAAELLGLSYRQIKRVWARYRGGGAKALQHGNCGRVSNRSYSETFRQAGLDQVRTRYADFGPTLAAEHLAEEAGLAVAAETLRRWMKAAGCGGDNGGGKRIGSGGSASRISANWCSWTPAFIPGWKIAPPTAV